MSEPVRRVSVADSIEPIATLPVFFKLGGRRVLLAGGTLPAVWKAELLAAAGADVAVVAEDPCAEMMALAERLPSRAVIERRAWAASDFEGAALAIGAFDGDDGRPFRDAARRAGVPVNVIDVPPLCDFQFGTIIARSPLLIGISTDGAAPVFGQALRARIEALLPNTIAAWAVAAKTWRESMKELGLDFAARRRFWETFSAAALDGTGASPTETVREACVAAALGEGTRRAGRLTLVGAGPGPTELLTLQAIRALQSADVVFFEDDVAPESLSMARREAIKASIGPERDQAMMSLTQAVEDGKSVVWIGPGDPIACPIWMTRYLDGIHPTLVAGLRCPTCPEGCAAPSNAISDPA